VAVDRAERTLRSWRLTEAEIAAVRAEAAKLSGPTAGPTTDRFAWARVEVRSPRDGVVLEKNVTAGDIVDTTTDLFKIGDLKHLTVWANVFEEELPLLQALPKPIAWTVNVPSRPGATFHGTLDQIAPTVDLNQNTALVNGSVDNSSGELKVGQYVTVSVEFPAPANELELPTEAVIEDGRESVVFVKTGEAGEYRRTRVRVVRRFRDVIYVSKDPSGVVPGDRVVTHGGLLLRDAFDQLPAGD
jgi:cobalt-zinc-cadmium efflux system membrane fusion protein